MKSCQIIFLIITNTVLDCNIDRGYWLRISGVILFRQCHLNFTLMKFTHNAYIVNNGMLQIQCILECRKQLITVQSSYIVDSVMIFFVMQFNFIFLLLFLQICKRVISNCFFLENIFFFFSEMTWCILQFEFKSAQRR